MSEINENNVFETKNKRPVHTDGKIVYLGGEEESIPCGITEISGYSDKQDIVSVILPDSVTKIDCRAFNNCTRLQKIIIPYGVKEIDSQAFYDCANLTKIFIPISVINIGYAAFLGCYNLKEVYYGGTKDHWRMLNLDASLDASNVLLSKAKLYYSGKIVYSGDFDDEELIPHGTVEIKDGSYKNKENITKIILPQSVTTIGESAFASCSELKYIEVPNSVKMIEDNAFDQCSQLTDIYYGGSKSDWRKIKIGKNNSKLNGIFGRATVHYNMDLARI